MPFLFALIVFGIGVYSLVVAIQGRNENRLKTASDVALKKKYDLTCNDNLYDVDNFNRWFNAPKPKEIYAHSGIFGRTDKLSLGHFVDYICSFGLTKSEAQSYCDDNETRFMAFHKEVEKDWIKF